MELKNIKTYNSPPERVFETLCSQLFENWLEREFKDIKHFSVVNGAGGDGGVEAYAIRSNDSIVGLQAKWFTSTITPTQIKQIRKSIITAKNVRPELHIYIVCLPRETHSKKRGKDKTVNSNTEEGRLDSLVNEIKAQFKDLEVIFWKETRLISELKHPENDGLVKLWFEKEELSFGTLLTRFDLAKSGWLSDRYFPELHNQSIISELIDKAVVSDKHLKNTLTSLQEKIDDLSEALKLIKYYLSNNRLDESLNLDLEKIKQNFELYRAVYTKVKAEIKINRLPSQNSIEEVKLFPIITNLEQTVVPNILKETHRKLKNLLFQLHQVDLSQYLDHIKQYLKPHNYIILGEPGAGKTHGIAFEVESKLKREEPALLIRAKDFEHFTWKQILSDALQCCDNWSDSEILSAFTSLARRISISSAAKKKNDKFFNNNTKFLICVDGIDESTNPEKWQDLINETKVWLNKFPNIRFIFTCRSYPPLNQNPFSLPHDDDKIYRKDIYTHNSALSFEYLNHFNIKYENTPWIINSFENNLALRLFCEEYKGKDLSKEFKNPVFNSSNTLLEHKVDRLDKEFNRKLDRLNTSNEKYVKKSLGRIVKLFTQNSKIEKSILRANLHSYLDEVLLKREINVLLDLLSDSGFLIYYSEPSSQDYGNDKEYYEIGIQTYFDFLLAKEYARNIYERKQKNIPSELLDNRYAYVRILTGLALLNDNDLFVGQNGLWESDFDNWDLLKLQFDILSLASEEILVKYESFLKEVFLSDRDRFIEHFALVNSSRVDFNIINNIVHKTLLNFPNTYQRDLFWSGPDNHDINGHSHLSFCFEYRSLYFLSKHSQEPLLYAWALSTTSRSVLERIKNELTQWALNDLEGFVKLLDTMYWRCNDGQIQEGLAAVIYGLSSLINKDTPEVIGLVEWIKTEIFHPSRISEIKSSVIRHSCRCFIEKSYKLGLCDFKTFQSSIPPYKYNLNELLPFDSSGVVRDSGIYPIEHDLYWTTIEDAYDSFVEYVERDVCDDIKTLLKSHNTQFTIPKEFFTRVALQFLKDLGWKKEGLYAGIGSSQFMTFEEKYTSLAVHHIQGYLADRITYKEHGKKHMLTDYSYVQHITNPAHKEMIKIEYLNNNSVKWFVPEDFSPVILTSKETVKKDIKDWTTNQNQYNFVKWLFPKQLKLLREENKIKDTWFVLDSYIALSEPTKIGRAWLDINCVLVDEKNYCALKTVLTNIRNKVKLDSNSFKAGINGHVYNSLIDIIWRDSTLEYNQEITLIDTDTTIISAYPTTTELSERSESGSDVKYNIPSSILRKLLDINSTDKISFSRDNTVMAISHSAYENSSNNQKMLLADKTQIIKALEAKKLLPVWICTEFRSTINNPIITENKAHWQNCRKWICLGTEQTLDSYLIHNDYYK